MASKFVMSQQSFQRAHSGESKEVDSAPLLITAKDMSFLIPKNLKYHVSKHLVACQLYKSSNYTEIPV